MFCNSMQPRSPQQQHRATTAALATRRILSLQEKRVCKMRMRPQPQQPPPRPLLQFGKPCSYTGKPRSKPPPYPIAPPRPPPPPPPPSCPIRVQRVRVSQACRRCAVVQPGAPALQVRPSLPAVPCDAFAHVNLESITAFLPASSGSPMSAASKRAPATAWPACSGPCPTAGGGCRI
jgi:hypothetical protein